MPGTSRLLVTVMACMIPWDSSQSAQGATVTMTMEGKELVLEVDTGASVTVIPNEMFKGKLGHLKLRPVST